MEVRIAPDPDRVGDLAAATVARWLVDGGSLGLAGGQTPLATYRQLLTQPVDWDSALLWMTDERWVPADHEDSNTAMARQALADHVAAELLEVPEVGAGDGTAAAAAADSYATTLQDRIGTSPHVVLLGIGDDGHTASLFPGTTALSEMDKVFVANWVESKGTWRLTATLPYLWAATQMAFVVTGEAKAAVLAEIIGGGSDLPAAMAADGAQDVTWFLDEAAASLLQ
ncbi:MAG: 6-phosphogluconolactonase [Acidimicrobiia bacterium]|nr:6-phosphogluconolactonase [Acidimicrobiia bacterium]